MIKKLSMTGVFERINGLKPETRFNEQSDTASERADKVHSESLLSQGSHNTEQSVSNPDTVTLMQQCQPVTVSTDDTVDMEIGSKRAVKSNFTAVPNAVLREASQFQDPVDFMIYMHLLTYSHGFGRETAAMGQTQLERFTGAAKNTVKKSLDRLVVQKFIKLVEEYEHSRTTRKWKVFLPETQLPGHGPSGPKKSENVEGDSSASTVSRGDSVKSRHCQDLTQTVSKSDSVTVSNFDTNKERDPKETFKENLSQESSFESSDELPERLKKYFSELRPKGKLDSERKAFQELRLEYQTTEINQAFEHLKRYGLPKTGESCHSPMAFLRVGMSQVKAIRIQENHSIKPTFLDANEKFQIDSPSDVLIQKIPSAIERMKLIKVLTSDFPGIDIEGPFAASLAATRYAKMEPCVF